MTTARREADVASELDEDQVIAPAPSRALRSISIEIEEDRRAGDPVQRLSREFDAACTQAVSPHQIAALLEAEGLNDRIVRSRYDTDSVFTLARTLYDLVPLRMQADDTIRLPSGMAVPRRTLLLRGPLYLLPLLFFALVGTYFSRPSVAVAGLLALLVAWAWNQGSGTLVHRLIGRGAPPAGRAAALLSLGGGVVLIPAVTVPAAALVTGFTPLALGFVIGQTLYLLGASTLLVFGRDRSLVVSAGGGLALVAAAVTLDTGSSASVLAASASLPVLVGAAAVWTCRGANPSGLQLLGRVDLRLAATMAVIGLMWAGIIGAGAIPLLDGDDAILILSIAASGMVLSMGYAEWLTVRLRIDAAAALQSTPLPSEFARSMRGRFRTATTKLAVTVTLVTAVVAWGASLAGRFPTHAWFLAGAYAVLSIAFFAGLALVIAGRAGVVLAISAFVLLEVLAAMAIGSLDTRAMDVVYLTGCAALATTFTVLALRAVVRPVVHR